MVLGKVRSSAPKFIQKAATGRGQNRRVVSRAVARQALLGKGGGGVLHTKFPE